MFITDEIEKTAAYQEAMKEIQPVLDKEFPPEKFAMGTCHRFWYLKKELLKKHGIDWKSPAELNPDVRFD